MGPFWSSMRQLVVPKVDFFQDRLLRCEKKFTTQQSTCHFSVNNNQIGLIVAWYKELFRKLKNFK